MTAGTGKSASLESRLGRAGIATLLILAGLLWLLGRQIMNDALQAYVVSRLQHDAETLLAALTPQPDGLALDSTRFAGIYNRPHSGHYFVIEVPGRAPIRSRSLWERDLPGKRPGVGETHLQVQESTDGSSLLVFTAGYRKAGQEATIRVAEDISHQRVAAYRFDLFFGSVVVLGMFLLGWVLRRRVRAALAPLELAAAELKALEDGSLRRLSTEVPSEVRPLIDRINQLLSATNERLNRSRRAMGDLAHALKAPLTLLGQDIARVGAEAVRSDLGEHSDRIRQLVERGLHRARLAGNAVAGEIFMPAEDTEELVSLLQHLYPQVSWRTRLPPQATRTGFDKEDMLELLGNLLDNAGKWSGGEVLVAVTTGISLELRIEDDGPGIPAGERTGILNRGTRLDESIAGHGLGLAIAQDIVHQYDGQMELLDSELGGLLVRVSLPSSN